MNIKKKLLIILILVLLFIFFTNVKYINESVYNSLLFCLKSLIPSIFPFMVLSLFIIKANVLGDLLNGKNFKIANKLGVCKKYITAIVLGSFSGYITGAKCICEIYDKDPSDENTFSNAVILSTNAGIGFVISYVGIILWKDALFGVYIYVMQIIISALLALTFFHKAENVTNVITLNNASISKSLTASVIESTNTLFKISSYYLFFSLITDILNLYFFYPLNSIISVMCEFCKGIYISKQFPSLYLSSFLTGFTRGFGGLCVFIQLLDVCDGYPLNKKKYFIFKFFHGIILGIASVLYFVIR